MFISLQIGNVDRLPDGGPMSYRSRDRGFEIGRENRDWTLPDPDMFISGRHCEVRYERGAFWLYDVSRNGTFVNGSTQRMASPYRLSHGDRLRIGRYIVMVSIADERSPPAVAGNLESNQQKPGGRATNTQGGPNASDFVNSFTGQGQSAQASPPSGPGRAAPAKPETLASGKEILRSIAAGAGVSPEVFLQREPQEIASEVGAFLRTVVDELVLLLKARAAAKALARSGHRTMISSADNNPLKFVPGAEEILEIMFTRRRTGYLDARQSLEEAFRDLKTHELATYAAMQAALSRLLDDLSPDAIERKVPSSSFASRKGRYWDAFITTWEAKEGPHENGMLDLFLAYFAEAYAKTAKEK